MSGRTTFAIIQPWKKTIRPIWNCWETSKESVTSFIWNILLIVNNSNLKFKSTSTERILSPANNSMAEILATFRGTSYHLKVLRDQKSLPNVVCLRVHKQKKLFSQRATATYLHSFHMNKNSHRSFWSRRLHTH